MFRMYRTYANFPEENFLRSTHTMDEAMSLVPMYEEQNFMVVIRAEECGTTCPPLYKTSVTTPEKVDQMLKLDEEITIQNDIESEERCDSCGAPMEEYGVEHECNVVSDGVEHTT